MIKISIINFVLLMVFAVPSILFVIVIFTAVLADSIAIKKIDNYMSKRKFTDLQHTDIEETNKQLGFSKQFKVSLFAIVSPAVIYRFYLVCRNGRPVHVAYKELFP